MALEARTATRKVGPKPAGFAGPVARLSHARRSSIAVTAPGTLFARLGSLHFWLPPLLASMRPTRPSAARLRPAPVGVRLIEFCEELPQPAAYREIAAVATFASAAPRRHGEVRGRAAAPVVPRKPPTCRVQSQEGSVGLAAAPSAAMPRLLAARRGRQAAEATEAAEPTRGQRQAARRSGARRRRAAQRAAPRPRGSERSAECGGHPAQASHKTSP